MATKPDIITRADIEKLLINFYDKVKTNPVIGFIFNDIAKVNWEQHLPIIINFWETILLDNPIYKKNAMEVHYALNRIVPLEKKHFDTWLNLFHESVDEHFSGKTATLAKTRAGSIAALMLHKINSLNKIKE